MAAANSSLSTKNDTVSVESNTHAKAYRYIALTLFPIIIAISIIGNSLGIWLAAKFKCAKGSVNICIIHKAICNIIISGIPTTLFVIETLLQKWPFGSVTCNATVVIEYAVLTTSNIILVIKCVEQYFAVVKPFVKIKRRYVRIMLIFAWIVGWPVAMPFVLFQSRFFETSSTKECSDLWVFPPSHTSKSHFAYFIAIFIIFTVLPFLCMTVLYSRVIYEFLYKMKRPGVLSRSTKERARKKKWNTVKMLVTSVVLFQICWLPSYIQEIVLFIGSERVTSDSASLTSLITSVMAYAYGAINPFVYFYFIEKYRKTLRIEAGRFFAFIRCCKDGTKRMDVKGAENGILLPKQNNNKETAI